MCLGQADGTVTVAPAAAQRAVRVCFSRLEHRRPEALRRMEAAAQGAQGVQGPAADADADLTVHTLLAAWREEKAAMREEAAARPACNPKPSRLQPHALEAATPRTGRHLAAFACGQVSLDCNEPDEVVFTCQKCAARQGGSQQREAHGEGGYRQGGGQSASQQSGYLQDEYAQQAAQQQLPYPWVQMADQDGALYYSNPLTGEAQWEAPHFTPQPGQGVDDYRQYPQQGGY